MSRGELIDVAGRLARDSGRVPVRRPRLGEDDAARSVGRAVATAVRVGGVDENDNDPIVLLTYVAAALDRVSPLDPSVFDALASPGVSVEATVVPRLGAALATIDQPFVLVLDDLHLLDNPACLDAVAALARHVPDGSQLALSARGAPALPLGALRARGLALEIGPDDLRMDEAEAGQLLSAAGVDLPDAQSPSSPSTPRAGPRVCTSPRCRSGPAGSTAKARPRSPGATGWCPTTCSRSCSRTCLADDLRFLTRTAVLERMSGPLCDAVLEESGSAAVLESLARSNLFLVPLDAQWGVVPLPPSLPGAAPIGAGASRAGSRAPAPRACRRLV